MSASSDNSKDPRGVETQSSIREWSEAVTQACNAGEERANSADTTVEESPAQASRTPPTPRPQPLPERHFSGDSWDSNDDVPASEDDPDWGGGRSEMPRRGSQWTFFPSFLLSRVSNAVGSTTGRSAGPSSAPEQAGPRSVDHATMTDGPLTFSPMENRAPFFPATQRPSTPRIPLEGHRDSKEPTRTERKGERQIVRMIGTDEADGEGIRPSS